MDNPFTWLRHAYLATRKAMDEDLASYGITFAMVDVLVNLRDHDGLEHRILQERIGTTSATLTTVIDGLVERGLVERRQSSEDARVKQLFLTEQGRLLNDRLARRFAQFQQRLLLGFSSAETALLREWLGRMTHNMEVAERDEE